MIRLIHSSDIHLGKPFGGYPEDVRVKLRLARAETLKTLAALAKANGASHILLAGDTFDQTTPLPTIVRQAMNAMGAAPDVVWVLMPGNHDHSNATALWRQVMQDAPSNVTVLLSPTPFPLTNGAVLLPAPPSERHPGRDLTEWFDNASTGDAVRIGIAHGSVTDFERSEDGGSSIIPIDRARRAGLAYLGLGDWHGQVKIGPETWYSGAPEADSFKHAKSPSALLVEIAAANAPAKVNSLPTCQIVWHRDQLELSVSDDANSLHDQALPPLTSRASTMFDMQIVGRVHALARVALEKAAKTAAPDFLWHNVDFSRLGRVHDTTDLDAIDRQGAMRAAAEALAREAADPQTSAEARTAAEDALSELFSYVLED